MLSDFAWGLFDPLIAAFARRAERLRVRDRRPPLATLAPTARLHPGGEVANHLNNAAMIRIGAHSHVRGQLRTFWNAGEISIGEWSYVGEGSRIWSQCSVTIGDHVLISHGVDIHDTDSHPLDWRARRRDIATILGGKPYTPAGEIAAAPVAIEDDVWIGMKACVLKGVRVGRGAIVAAGSVVTRDVPAWSIAAGNPARVVRELGPDER